MAKKTIEEKAVNAANLKRPIPKFKTYKCNCCRSTFNNENFAVDDERDCPVCDHRDCVRAI